MLRIYGFNLLLLPVNLAGSLSSIVQGLTGAKGRFMRTPKVRNRTVPAFVYVVLPYVLVALSAYTFMGAYQHGLWGDAVFAAVNAVLASYAIVAFVGIRNSLVDIWTNVVSWLYKPERFQPAPLAAVRPRPGRPERPAARLGAGPLPRLRRPPAPRALHRAGRARPRTARCRRRSGGAPSRRDRRGGPAGLLARGRGVEPARELIRGSRPAA